MDVDAAAAERQHGAASSVSPDKAVPRAAEINIAVEQIMLDAFAVVGEQQQVDGGIFAGIALED